MPATTTVIMVLANVGMQIFNNWRNTQSSNEIRKKQQEFQLAAQKRDHERMLQLLHEGQELQKQREAENHIQRIQYINEDFDNLVTRTFYQQALPSWPLTVLPMVMKNQSLGSFRNKSDENIALHVILTPSNSTTFNTNVFPQIELGVEAFCNRYWNNLSEHPIIFYSGAWKSNKAPLQPEIDQLRASLRHLPVLMITPYFSKDGEFVFNINMWGMGEKHMRIGGQSDINTRETRIEPTEQELSKCKAYTLDTDYDDELKTITIREFVPYLQCMIGYLADVYFWSAHNRTPILPTLTAISALKITGKQQKDLEEGYSSLYKLNLGNISTGLDALTILSDYLSATTYILDNTLFQHQLESLYIEACRLRGYNTNNIKDAIISASKNDVFLPCDATFLARFAELHKGTNSMRNKNNKKYNIMKNLDATAYAEKRNELLNLINEVLKVKEITDIEKKAFLQTQKRLQENQFNIVLIGEFQGGKSTTFNALCGGREISPRGAMTKTSAVCITATNIADAKADEFAIVNWKSTTDYLKLMDSFAGMITAEDLGVTLTEDEPFSLYEHFSFEKDEHIKVLRKYLEKQEEFCRSDFAKSLELNEVLRIAKVIISFANDKTIRDYKENVSQISIGDVAKYTVFPKDWETKWTKIKSFDDIRKRFKAEDVLFAFVGGIDCHIHSENLARLGCSVTDCPGLFASSWDTSVALNAMSHSNAAVYLLGGSKKMGEGDEKAIKMIFQQQTLKNKVFFAINQKENDGITANIIKEDRSTLKNMGISDPTIWNFHALLFFLSEFGSNYVRNTIDGVSVKRFIEIAERNGYDELIKEGKEQEQGCSDKDIVKKIYLKMVRKLGFVLDKEQLQEVNDINNDAINKIREISSADKMLSAVNDSLISQKAESILICNGANKLLGCLESVQGRLQLKEDDALKTVEEMNAEYIRVQKVYKDFAANVDKILSSNLPSSIAYTMADNMYSKEFTARSVIESIALKLTIAIPKQLKTKEKTKAVLFGILDRLSKTAMFKNLAPKKREELESELSDLLEPVVRIVVETELGDVVKLWKEALFKGEHADYIKSIVPASQQIIDEINKQWDLALLSNPTLTGFGIDNEVFSNGIDKMISTDSIASKGEIVGGTSETIIATMVQQTVETILSMVIGSMVATLVDALITGGLFTLVMAIGGAVVGLIGKLKDGSNSKDTIESIDNLNKKQEQLYNSLRLVLVDYLSADDTKQSILSGLIQIPSQILREIRQYYQGQLAQSYEALENEIEVRRANKQKSQEEQEKIAQKSKTIREKEIEPLIGNIKVFIESCYN